MYITILADNVGISGYVLRPYGIATSKCQNSECQNDVYFDPDLGEFEYCMPKCRDKHLLDKNATKLKDSVRELETLARECCCISYPSKIEQSRTKGKSLAQVCVSNAM